MRLNNAVNTLETNTQSVSTNFGIGDVGMVIEILRSKLYSHPIRTLVQEYACNGRDAMREVKSKERLIITAPTTFNPEFRVRDFGPGISPERIENVFVLYGASTKRKDNTQTGGFGIGAKSAWSYTDSFTITTFIDGTKREYVAHIGTSQNGSLDLVTETSTDEKNGTEIKIAVSTQDIVKFQKAIQRAVFFWEEQEKPELRCVVMPSLLTQNGDEIRIEELLITDKSLDFLEVNNSYYGGRNGDFFIVVDGVPYNIDEEFVSENANLKEFRTKVSHRVSVFCSVQTGIVEVSANREQLSDSKHTRGALNLIAKRWTNLLDKYHADKFANCKTVMDFLKAQSMFEKVFVRSSFTNDVDGYKISDCRVSSDLFTRLVSTEVTATSNENLKYSTKPKKVFHIDELSMLFVNDLPDASSKKERAAYLRAAVKLNSKKTLRILSNGIHVTKYDDNHKAVTTFEKLSDTEWNKLITDLEIKKLSSVTPDVRTRATKTTNSDGQKQKGEITIWKNSRGDKRNINLDLDTTKYVFLGIEDKVKHAEFIDVAELMGYSLVRMSDSTINKVKDAENFLEFGTFLTMIKDDSKLKQAYTDWKLKGEACYIKELVKIKNSITNSEIKSMVDKTSISTQGDYSNGAVLSNSVIEMIESWTGMNTLKKEITEFATMVKTKYAIVEHVSWRQESNENIIWYVNNRK